MKWGRCVTESGQFLAPVGPCLTDHPVRRRPTLRGADQGLGVKVELPTGRTPLTPRPWSARLVLGRWRTG
jgi:hypothetical protein